MKELWYLEQCLIANKVIGGQKCLMFIFDFLSYSHLNVSHCGIHTVMLVIVVIFIVFSVKFKS